MTISINTRPLVPNRRFNRAPNPIQNTLIISALFLIGSTIWSACGEPGDVGLDSAESSATSGTDEGATGALEPGKGDADGALGDGELKPFDREAQPVKALYITNYSNRWHDYEAQQSALKRGIGRHIQMELDLVGKSPADALALMEAPRFGEPYDVIIYNMCFADDFSLERINNIISQTRDLGVPAVLLHCAMHSFQQTSPRYPEHQLELSAAEWDWRELHPDTEFPYWWRFTGVDTLTHDWQRELSVERAEGDHPITRALPEQLKIRSDELYRNLEVVEGIEPLLTAYSVESRRDHLVAWTHRVGEGEVFATTLGHNENTTERDEFHRLIAYAIGHLTKRLNDDGSIPDQYKGSEAVDNYQATVTCHPSDVINATSVEEVVAAVRRASLEQRPIKVISVPRSNSNSQFICPDSGGILLNLSAMNQMIELDEAREVVTVQPGITASELSQKLHERGFAIPSMPDYTGVSIAGGVATGAHHSSLTRSSNMADMVESLTFVDGRGEIRRLDGDEVAGAATHLGLLGVLVELELKVEPQFKLQYGHEGGRDEGLEDQIEDMVRAHDYARVMWFAGNGRYVLDYYNRVGTERRGTSSHNLWASSGSVFRIVGDLPYRVLNRAPLRAQCDSALVRSRVWLAPFDVRDSDRSAPVGWSHEMLGSTCAEGRCPWSNDSVRSRTMEVSFPVRYLKQWMSDVRALLEKRRACFPILGLYLRFSKGSDRWLSFNYGEDVVSVEIHIPKVASETYHERSADVYDELIQLTLARYDARPHWGKNSAPFFADIGARQYPRWGDFKELKRSFDPDGLFENRAWRQMNGEAQPEPFPGCVLSRDCICSEDSHCGSEYTCEAGLLYQEARVCRPR